MSLALKPTHAAVKNYYAAPNQVGQLHFNNEAQVSDAFAKLLYTYAEDGTHRRENITDWALEQFRARYHDPSITKWDIFHYIYAVLHHPEYRERYAANLKRELPRIPFAPDFAAFAQAGKELAHLHVEYESLTLDGIPAEALDYRLGSRSALEWVVDQYQVKGESDPNREDDPGYIVRLIGQVVRVSIETQRIVKALPAFRLS